MVTCKICKKKFRIISHKHLKRHGLTIQEYLKRFKLHSEDLTGATTRKRLSKSLKGKINIGENNPAKRVEVRKAISETIKLRWKEGSYDDRINGMSEIIGNLHPNWKPENHTLTYMAKNNSSKFLSNFQSIKKCMRCSSKKTINVHHINEDHDNFLISNLEPLCVPCHASFHYGWSKQPFISITKTFSIAAAHYLPDYDGKCSNMHGHEWSLEVRVKKRVDKKTGMVMDFSDIKKIVTSYVIDKLDHNIINNYIENPTAENIIVFVWETLMFDALLKGIDCVTIWESPTSYCKIDQQGMLSLFSSNIEDYLEKYSKEPNIK